MIEDLRIIAKDGGRLSAGDRQLIEAAADEMERLGAKVEVLSNANGSLARKLAEMETRDLRTAVQTSELAYPRSFDEVAFFEIVRVLQGGQPTEYNPT